MKWILFSLFILPGLVWADACIDTSVLDSTAGCSCNFATYQNEMRRVERVIRGLRSGASPVARATVEAWGVNPCQVRPSATEYGPSQTSRYHFNNILFDFGAGFLRGHGTKVCREACTREPWRVAQSSLQTCSFSSSISHCGPKYGMASNDVASRCQSHGTNHEACNADSLCEVSTRHFSQDECQRRQNFSWQNVNGENKCVFNTCVSFRTRNRMCDVSEKHKCLVNCNDCQAMTFSALSNLDLKCFTVRRLESFSVRGNFATSDKGGGTHSMVQLVPKSGSIATLMAPKGILVDAWNDVHLRRVSHCEVDDPDDKENDHYVNLTLVPEFEGERQVPFELLPYATGVSDQVSLSNGCNINTRVAPNNMESFIQNVLRSFYHQAQNEYCNQNSSNLYELIRVNASIASDHYSQMARTR